MFWILRGPQALCLLQNIQTSSVSLPPASHSMSKGWWGHKRHNSLPPSAQVKNEWCYTSAIPHAFMLCTRTSVFSLPSLFQPNLFNNGVIIAHISRRHRLCLQNWEEHKSDNGLFQSTMVKQNSFPARI